MQSKSHGNIVKQHDMFRRYGAEAVRDYQMFIGPRDQGGPWNPKGIEGITRFLNRVWSVVLDEAPQRESSDGDVQQLRRAVHTAIKEATQDFEGFTFNTAVAQLMTLQGAMSKLKGSELPER